MRDWNDVDRRVRPPRSRDRRVSKMSEPIVKRRPMIDLEEFERRLRKPHTTNQRDDDPLAELARSFAGEDDHQHWPYADAGDSHEVDTAYEEVRSRRPLWIMAAMIVAGIAGIGASFGFKGAATNPSEITTIRAADGPTKIHPDTVPSTEVPDRDASVLGGVQQQPPVAAVNNVEQPTDLSAQAYAEPSSAVTGLASGAASVPVPQPPVQAQPQQPSDGIAALIEPKKVKTVSVRPVGTLLSYDSPPQGVAPGSPAAHPAAVSPAKAATPKSTARVATTPKPPAAAPNVSADAAKTSIAPKAKRVQVADAQDQVPGAEAARAA